MNTLCDIKSPDLLLHSAVLLFLFQALLLACRERLLREGQRKRERKRASERKRARERVKQRERERESARLRVRARARQLRAKERC